MIEQFKAFVASKPAAEAYDPAKAFHCALAQFGKIGVTLGTCEQHGVPVDVYKASVFEPEDNSPTPLDYYTFGALADRLARIDAKAVAE